MVGLLEKRDGHSCCDMGGVIERSKMKIEIKDNLIKRVIKHRFGKDIEIPDSELEKYHEAIASVIDGLLRWALFELGDKSK